MVSAGSVRQEAFSQLHTAYEGSNDFLLKGDLMHRSTDIEQMGEQLKHWLTDERVDYIQRRHDEGNTTHTLVATPAVELPRFVIRNIADKYNKSTDEFQGSPGAHIGEKIWNPQLRTKIAGVGAVASGHYNFSLIPDEVSVGFKAKPLEQRKRLAELQYNNPDVTLGVPSVLDAIVRWSTLRARGVKDAMKVSNITHFDTHIIRVDGWNPVLATFLLETGKPFIAGDNSNTALNARIALK